MSSQLKTILIWLVVFSGLIATASLAAFEPRLRAARYGPVTTEIVEAPEFYFAEDYHQQYLAKNPGGYCGIGGTGVACSVGLVTDRQTA